MLPARRSALQQWKKGDKRETDDWHEDDHEWKRKMAQKYHVRIRGRARAAVDLR